MASKLSKKGEALYRIVLEIRHLFHALANAADRAHADLGVSASQRAVLESLHQRADQTVPGIARAKGVSRQHIQVTANHLLAAGLIEESDNPAHKRSPHLNLSAAGRECFSEIRVREGRTLAALAKALAGHDLDAVGRCLRDMSAFVDQWNDEEES